MGDKRDEPWNWSSVMLHCTRRVLAAGAIAPSACRDIKTGHVEAHALPSFEPHESASMLARYGEGYFDAMQLLIR